MKSPITTHILDLSKGKPAANVDVQLEKQDGETWKFLGQGATNADGRVETLLKAGTKAELGLYRLTFQLKSYFGSSSFYPYAQVIFEVKDQAHHHIPLLVSPFGYSTYKGS